MQTKHINAKRAAKPFPAPKASIVQMAVNPNGYVLYAARSL
jgi:hypothetical protein